MTAPLSEGLYERRGWRASWGEKVRYAQVLVVHDEPRVDWTNEPTCLVRRGDGDHVWTQRRFLELYQPASVGAESRRA